MYQQSYRGGFFASIPLVIRNIIIINIVMLLLSTIKESFMIENFALFYPQSPFFKPWQILTHMFMHGGFGHLLFNMYALWMFGAVLEQIWGPKRFLIYYLVTGLGAAAIHMGVQWLEASSWLNAIQDGSMAAYTKYQQLLGTPTVGASGAVYGVLLAYGMLFPDNRLYLMFTPFSLKAKYMVLIFFGLELLLGLIGGGNVAHFAHLGGMIFGFFLVRYWKKQNRMYY